MAVSLYLNTKQLAIYNKTMKTAKEEVVVEDGLVMVSAEAYPRIEGLVYDALFKANMSGKHEDEKHLSAIGQKLEEIAIHFGFNIGDRSDENFTTLDGLLDEDGIKEEVTEAATKRVEELKKSEKVK